MDKINFLMGLHCHQPVDNFERIFEEAYTKSYEPFLGVLERVDVREEDFSEAKRLAGEYIIPLGDALHATIARNNDAVLVSQDKHFQRLKDLIVKRPEELL